MSRPALIGLNADIRKLPRWGVAATALLTYVNAIEQAGGVPLIIPALTDRPALEAALAHLDGLLLTGGLDISPRLYGQRRHPATRLAAPRRLAGDRALLEAALDTDIPILGICMGCQWLNVALGGDLIQDIPSQVGTEIVHAPRETFHPVRVQAGSRLAAILGREELEVNSSHHQAIGRLGRGLRAVAWAPDGVIEAAEGEGERFLLAVQWHPERIVDRPEHLALFQALVAAAGERRE